MDYTHIACHMINKKKTSKVFKLYIKDFTVKDIFLLCYQKKTG